MELSESAKKLAGAVRDACVEAARRGYDEAAISGLCHEGAVECSVDAIRSLDIEAVIRALGTVAGAGD